MSNERYTKSSTLSQPKPAIRLIIKKAKQNHTFNYQQQSYDTPTTATEARVLILASNSSSPNLTNINVNTSLMSPEIPPAPQSADPDRDVLNDPISGEAKAFAQSRYPYPAFILRFSTPHIDDKTNYRRIMVNIWSKSILGLIYNLQPLPAIPPQLSLIIENVSLSINFIEFTNGIKSTYSSVTNVIRLKNKPQSPIKLVKLEFMDNEQRDELLNGGKIFINSLTYDVDEYLGPARVLICSKCMGIGHFRKQCQQEHDTCNKCGNITSDLKNHLANCTQLKCKHCKGDHMANEMKCPVIKQFRANVTRCLLAPVAQAIPHYNLHDMSSANFLALLPAQRTTIFKPVTHRTTPSSTSYNWPAGTNPAQSMMNNKIDVLIKSLEQVQLSPNNISN
ncbi:unnamed protein product [Adineta ricciae]|uniref:CCHC-type domain-containing protein n=1 Tax=Adineta ricciae TaxID=249248 RepID=A0A814RN28_ADIRI|nr:unnamed protein product [Adineta ricciae]CAF1232420.1 unnamed protein product [Adineta ricciae]